MSAPLAGKFQDHYLILGITPKADTETIQNAYIQAAKKYSPDNPLTGDEEKFDAINLAYEVLSDPQLRVEFDKVKGLDQEEGPAQFSGLPFFRSLDRAIQIRSTLLCLLCDRRRMKPFRPSLAMRDVEASMNVSLEELSVTLWYLKHRGLVSSDDKSSLQITPDGVDFLEANRPSPDAVLPLIRPSALAGANAEQKPAEQSRLDAGAQDEIADTPAADEEPAEALVEEPVTAEAAAPETNSILALLRRASGDRLEALKGLTKAVS